MGRKQAKAGAKNKEHLDDPDSDGVDEGDHVEGTDEDKSDEEEKSDGSDVEDSMNIQLRILERLNSLTATVEANQAAISGLRKASAKSKAGAIEGLLPDPPRSRTAKQKKSKKKKDLFEKFGLDGRRPVDLFDQTALFKKTIADPVLEDDDDDSDDESDCGESPSSDDMIEHVLAQAFHFGGFTQYVRSLSFNNQRNLRECKSLAEALDALWRDKVSFKSTGIEIMVRRLGAVQLIDETGTPEIAMGIEFNPTRSLLPRSMVSKAIKEANQYKNIAKRKSNLKKNKSGKSSAGSGSNQAGGSQ